MITVKNGTLHSAYQPGAFLAPYADRDGNIYFKDAAAARFNGGKRFDLKFGSKDHL